MIGKKIVIVSLLTLTACATTAIPKSHTLAVVKATSVAVVQTVTQASRPTVQLSATPQLAIELPTNSVPTCVESVCIDNGHFLFQNPIPNSGNRFPDQTYRYGSDQNGTREIHHGVEFPNKAGVAVLAAGDGDVIFAAGDVDTQIAWLPDFYGNVVVIRHFLTGQSVPFYTLYAHLQEIKVSEGQKVRTGNIIGTVGSTGKAVGSHLHFEVRRSANRYDANQNPVLWIRPEPGSGVLAGSVRDVTGTKVNGSLNIQKVIDGVTSALPYTGVETYVQNGVPVGVDPIYDENFSVGNMPVGEYRISIVYEGKIFEQYFKIVDGKLTVVNLIVN